MSALLMFTMLVITVKLFSQCLLLDVLMLCWNNTRFIVSTQKKKIEKDGMIVNIDPALCKYAGQAW